MHQIDDFSVTFQVVQNGEQKARQFSTRDFIEHLIRTGRQFNSDLVGIRIGMRIGEACKRTAKGPIAIDSQDWEVLAEASKSPSPVAGMPPYPLSPGSHCVPLVERIIDAKRMADPKPKRA
jgi:hypothetical protein